MLSSEICRINELCKDALGSVIPYDEALIRIHEIIRCHIIGDD